MYGVEDEEFNKCDVISEYMIECRAVKMGYPACDGPVHYKLGLLRTGAKRPGR